MRDRQLMVQISVLAIVGLLGVGCGTAAPTGGGSLAPADAAADSGAAVDAGGDTGSAGTDSGTTGADAAPADTVAPGDTAHPMDMNEPMDSSMPMDTSMPMDSGPIDSGPAKDVPSAQDTGPTIADAAVQADAGVSMGGCDNAADKAKLDDPAFAKATGDCGMQSMGDPTKAAQCVQGKSGISDACSVCFGKVVQCAMQKCLMQCIGGDTPDCQKCNAVNCYPDFTKCSGVTP